MPQPAGGPPVTKLTDLPGLLTRADGWANLRAALDGGRSGTVDGAWGSSAAAAVAALAVGATAPVVVVVPGVGEVAGWAEDLHGFAGVRPAVFPAHDTWPPPTVRGRIADETSRRLRLLQQLLTDPPALVLAPMAAVLQPVPPRDELTSSGRRLRVGESVDLDEFAAWLVANSYKRVEAVEFPGEFGRRGGLLDLFPPDLADPVRLEFFGDELESVRTFSAQTQRSLDKRDALVVLGVGEGQPHKADGRSSLGFLGDYLPPKSVVALVEPQDLKEQGRHFFERVADPAGLFTVDGGFAQLMARPTVVVSALPRPSVEASVHLRVESVERFSGNVTRVRDELDAVAHADRVLIACQTEAECHRLTDVLKAGRLAESERLILSTGHVRAGFRLVGAGVVVLGSHQLFHRDLSAAPTKADGKSPGRRLESRAIDSFLDLQDGDYVVHVAHGIARFRGMKMLERGMRNADLGIRNEEPEASARDSAFPNLHSAFEENLILEFRDGVMLYVPASRIDLVQKYVGGAATAQPELSPSSAGRRGASRKDKVAEAVQDMAAEMLQVQAMRNGAAGRSR